MINQGIGVYCYCDPRPGRLTGSLQAGEVSLSSFISAVNINRIYDTNNGVYRTYNPLTPEFATFQVLTPGASYLIDAKTSFAFPFVLTSALQTGLSNNLARPSIPALTTTATTIEADWDAPVIGAAPTSYTVQYSLNGGSFTGSQSTAATSYTFTNLVAGTYVIRVRSAAPIVSEWAVSTPVAIAGGPPAFPVSVTGAGTTTPAMASGITLNTASGNILRCNTPSGSVTPCAMNLYVGAPDAVNQVAQVVFPAGLIGTRFSFQIGATLYAAPSLLFQDLGEISLG